MNPETLIKLTTEYDSNLLKVESYDNGEPMVNLITSFQELPQVEFDTNNNKLHFLRDTIAKALKEACLEFVELGFTPQIVFTYRPISIQFGLFQRRVIEMKDKNPALENDQVLSLANMFSAGIPKLAAHTQGAAVDILLKDKHGNLLDFGTAYPAGTHLSHTDSVEISKEAQENRKILVGTMKKHGFANYPFEYWHFSLGDTDHAYQNGLQQTMYSPIDYDQNSGSFAEFDGDPNKLFEVSFG